MISGRPRGEHLSGSIKHTHTRAERKSGTLELTGSAPRLRHGHCLIRQCKVLDGPYHCISLVYQSQYLGNYTPRCSRVWAFTFTHLLPCQDVLTFPRRQPRHQNGTVSGSPLSIAINAPFFFFFFSPHENIFLCFLLIHISVWRRRSQRRINNADSDSKGIQMKVLFKDTHPSFDRRRI